ncbi:hypothetical protein QZJ86_12215 [Methylomonas montana]|uniref:DUF7706 family protein n=1 Tax=Methylomonas montana TaxID=3058963 RepID=UPI00265A9F00|nr:hypothetical protein [Methylomonas montana]WKJ88787.1 hypothetical protein QZJ86_12215 [Methylomonas montana]
MSTKTNPIKVDLPDDEALALAQLCKRISYSDCRTNAVDNAEAYIMLDAIAKLQKSLAEAGYSPR